jgi:hypothetical protein
MTAGYDYGAKRGIAPAGLAPASTAARLAALPPVGRLGLTSPRSTVVCDATTATWPSRGSSLVARSPIPGVLPSFVVSPQGSWPGRSAQPTPGLLVTRSPMPGLSQGARWLSQVPEFPLCRHAPLSDPGGVLHTRQSAPRTAAFQCVQTVGFPQRYTFRGSITRPTCSLHPAPYGPLRGGTRVRY